MAFSAGEIRVPAGVRLCWWQLNNSFTDLLFFCPWSTASQTWTQTVFSLTWHRKTKVMALNQLFKYPPLLYHISRFSMFHFTLVITMFCSQRTNFDPLFSRLELQENSWQGRFKVGIEEEKSVLKLNLKRAWLLLAFLLYLWNLFWPCAFWIWTDIFGDCIFFPWYWISYES